MQPVELSLMSATPTSVHAERCLWQRHRNAACKFCLDACLSGALQMAGRGIRLNTDRCTGCGACLVACPVECFETDEWSESSLVSTLERLKRPAVEVACKLHPAPQLGSEAVPVLQVSTCLAALSPGLWFETGTQYSIRVRLEACKVCPLSRLSRYAELAVELANSWLESCGHAASLSIQDTSSEQSPENRRVVISAERPILSRRDFLFAFTRSSGAPERALACLPADRVVDLDDKLPPHQPAWLRRLAGVYPGAATVPSEDEIPGAPEDATEAAGIPESPCTPQGALWPTLEVADNCAACGACGRYCSSGALSTTVKDGRFQHIFIPGVCVACGLCAQVCRSGALTRSYASEDNPFEERVMAERLSGTCRKCGSPALAELDGLCYWCAKEPPMASLLANARDILLGR